MLNIYDPFRNWTPDMPNVPGERFGETGTWTPGVYSYMRPTERVHPAMNKAIRLGVITKGPCIVCGSTEKVVAHHESYAMPYQIIWLCRPCHNARHIAWRYNADHTSQTPRIIGTLLYFTLRNISEWIPGVTALSLSHDNRKYRSKI